MTKSPAFCRILPFAIYVCFLIFESTIGLFESNGFGFLGNWYERWSYPVKILLIMLVLIWFRKSFTELATPVEVTWLGWLGGILVGVVIFILWINLDQPWAIVGVAKGYNPINPVSQQMDWVLVTFRIFGATIIVPVMEELFWRSFVMRWQMHPRFLEVNPAKVGMQAFFTTALLFASEHNLLVAGLVAGLAYNWLYIRTRNLWIPIVSHAVTNGLLGLWVLNTHNWQFW
jgi:CAAX prenyl protease-like protein